MSRAPTMRLLRSASTPPMRREADMMALTVCVALLAALTAGSDHDPHSKGDVILIVWATTVGLVLTHAFALSLAVRLAKDPSYTLPLGDLFVVQLVMATVIATTATLVVLAASSELDRFGARATAAVFLGLLVGVESRVGGASWLRASGWGVGSMAVGLALATTKWFVTS